MTQIQIIGITGKKFAGKDTLGNYFVENHGFERIAFADPLKSAIKVIWKLNDEQLYGDKKEVVDEFWGKTPREIMQFVGTDLFRNHIHELHPTIGDNFWVRAMEREITEKLKINPNAKFVITDIRFPNELKAIENLGGITIKINRNNLSNDMHKSETQIDDLVTNYTFDNNGTKEELYEKIKSINYL